MGECRGGGIFAYLTKQDDRKNNVQMHRTREVRVFMGNNFGWPSVLAAV